MLFLLLLLGFLPESINEAFSQQKFSRQERTPLAEEDLSKDWFRKVQVYGMLALPPNGVEKFSITVNGLWNGFFVEPIIASPFALGRYLESMYSGRTYETDEEFVQTLHDQGLLVPATLLTTQGHEFLQGEFINEFACRSANGEIPDFDPEAGSHFMCSNNPGWTDWLIEHGKKAIDAGADLIVLDEIQGNGFATMFQWMSQYLGIKESGFCSFCIEGFRGYLQDNFSASELKNSFAIDNIETYDLRNRIAGTMNLTYRERIAADPLIEFYIDFQEKNNYQAKKRLITALRDYAELEGKQIAISANSYTIGTNRPGGYWAKGLQFSELLDFFSFENKYTAVEDKENIRFPRNKWLAWEKLARAATKAPAVILLDAGAFKKISLTPPFIRKYSNYLSILCAEAYANKGAFVNWHHNRRFSGSPVHWQGCAELSGFILDHRTLYDAESFIDTEVAILYLYGEGMREKTDTYLGLAQALAESNIPFEVIFAGDGQYLEDSLTLDDLQTCSLVLIPSVIKITENQEKVIKEYVSKGGKTLIFNPEEIGLEPDGDEMEYGEGVFIISDQDLGAGYFQTYDNELRKKIEAVVKANSKEVLEVKNTGRKVVAFPYCRPSEKKVVVHLVNYNHRRWNDKVKTKHNLAIRIKEPDFIVNQAYVLSPSRNEKIMLAYDVDNGYVEMTIPELKVYAVVVIGN